MAIMNEALNILVENAATFKARNTIYALTEAEANKVSNDLITKLYKSAMSKAHIDFDDIPKSKGDITKYSGYKSMMETIGYIKGLEEKSSVKIKELEIVEKAILNIVAYRSAFEKGFGLGKDYIILQYNTLVACCVEATSLLISSYVDYVRRVDKIEFTLVNTKVMSGGICVTNLDKFNKSVASGEFSKIINTVIKTGSEGLTGAEMALIPVAIIAGVAASVVLIRELIFYFYYSKAKLSDYLKLQVMFIEMNRNNLEANTQIPAAKKNEILKKQAELAKKLDSAADRLKVNDTTTVTKVHTELKKETSGWSLDSAVDSVSKTDPTGFQLL